MRLRKKNVSRVAAVAVAAVMAVSAAAPVAVAAAPVANGDTAVVQAATKDVKINYFCWEENRTIDDTQVVSVDADATHVNSTQLRAPDGYELDVSGDPEINDGWAFVEVKKVATKTVKINFFSEEESKQIEEVEKNVSANATSVKSS